MTSKMALEVQGIRFGYGARDTLHDVTLEVPKGSFLGIVGPNGSGKSTLLKTMARALTPHVGTVLLDDRSVGRWNPREFAREAAVVSQEGTPAFDYTALEIVRMGRAPYERRLTPDRDARRAVESAMREVGVWELRERRLSRLSGGERQLVRLARALAQEPEVLLLDEPTNNLDIPAREALEEALIRYKGTIFFISHDRYFLRKLATRVVELENKKLVNYPGGYDYYRSYRRLDSQEGGKKMPRRRVRPGLNKNQSVIATRLVAVEGEIDATERRIGRLEKELATSELYADGERSRKVVTEHRQLKGVLEGLYKDWGVLLEEAEEADV